jgi:integrase
LVKKALTDAAVKRLKPPADGQIEVFDQGYPGLALRLSYGGSKAWVYFYRNAAGKLRRYTLGAYPSLSLAEARTEWRKAREAVSMGRDPAKDRKRQTGATEFAAVLAEWLKRDQGENRSHDQVKRMIDNDVLPAWKGRDISTIGRRDVLDIIDRVVDRGAPVLARRLHAHLHRLFRWSVGRGIIEANPMADLPKPGSENPRERVLSDAELKAVWSAANDIGWPFGQVVQLLILTGARRSEIGRLQWAEIGDGRIHLSGERTKNGEPHTIPLSKPALAITTEMPKVEDTDYVFTVTGKAPFSNWSKDIEKIRAAAGLDQPWTLHDLRRTVATGLQRLGSSLQVIEAVLGHVSGSRAGIVGTYQRHSFAKEKADALEAWGAHVEELIHGKPRGKVIAMRGKR